MPLNLEVSDEVAEALGGGKVTLYGPKELQDMILGTTTLEEVEAVVVPNGVVVCFELTDGEARAIARGRRQFFVHFITDVGILPFRLIFEEEGFDLGEQRTEESENNVFNLRLPKHEPEPPEAV